MNENFKVLSNGVKMPSIGFGTYNLEMMKKLQKL